MFIRLQYLNYECTYEQYFNEMDTFSNSSKVTKSKLILHFPIILIGINENAFWTTDNYFMKNNWL